MMDPVYVRTLARYNLWQNESLYGAAETLDEEARRRDRGAFFKSIHATLNHLLWADMMWMSRLSDMPKPEASLALSPTIREDWGVLKRDRAATDQHLIAWAAQVDADWLKGDLAWYSGAVKRDVVSPRWLVIAHMFNHQTHHRGQVHAMLTAAGAKPDDTDIFLMPRK
jgi:uncharacterized damage-inducible protein DinB